MQGVLIRGAPVCEFEHPDCFALLDDGACACLSDTDFKNGFDCPFYKTSESVAPFVLYEIRKMNVRRRKRENNHG